MYLIRKQEPAVKKNTITLYKMLGSDVYYLIKHDVR